jgi:TrmH RNA methyltransferase
VRAGLALIERRADDVLRVACTEELLGDLAEHTGRLRARGIELEVFPDVELSHLAGSDQHEGLLLQTRPRRFTAPQALGELLLRSEGVAIAFDRVRNPYNIGAVLRTAAFFGVEGALLGTPAPHPALHPLAVRVAEGGAEHLAISRTTDLAETLSRLRAAGILIAGAEDDGTPAALTRARANRKQPIVLVLGHEREGLSSRVREQCDAIVAIRGAGHVRSLNVSVAASILIADLMR